MTTVNLHEKDRRLISGGVQVFVTTAFRAVGVQCRTATSMTPPEGAPGETAKSTFTREGLTARNPTAQYL
jgi:hypothetical protein